MTIGVSDQDQYIAIKVKSPTVSLSRSKIFILDDEAPDSPTVTILEMYPEAAATTSMGDTSPGNMSQKCWIKLAYEACKLLKLLKIEGLNVEREVVGGNSTFHMTSCFSSLALFFSASSFSFLRFHLFSYFSFCFVCFVLFLQGQQHVALCRPE